MLPVLSVIIFVSVERIGQVQEFHLHVVELGRPNERSITGTANGLRSGHGLADPLRETCF